MDVYGGTTALDAVRKLAGLGMLAGVLAAMLVVPFVCGAGVSAKNSADWLLTEPADLGDLGTPQRSQIFAADGSLLATFFRQNRVDVKLKDMGLLLPKAVMAIEDSRFYEHGAMDTKGTLRALMANIAENTPDGAQGGSGITQQYVKNLLYVNAKTEAEKREATEITKVRKFRELRYAIALERTLSKDQILEKYLNVAYFGDGAYGVEAASRRYFSKSAKDLNLQEAATLAGILKNGNLYNARINGEGALKRRNLVLDQMVKLGWATQTAVDKAKTKKLELRLTTTKNGCTESKAPYFCDYVQREILANPIFGKTPQAREKLLWLGGLKIKTTLDWKTQNAAHKALLAHVPAKNHDHLAAAQTLIQPGTGEIKGMDVGRKLGDDREWGQTWINFAADADHGTSVGMAAGSTFKAFTLAAAFEEGMPIGERFTAPSGYAPQGFRNCKGQNVSDSKVLRNSAESEGGRSFSLLTGTWHSVNTFFLKLEKRVGLCDTVKMAEKLGIKRADGKPLKQFASFTLGFNEVSPLRVAAAYAAFAARGKYCEPIAIKKITRTTDGKSIPVPKANCDQVLDKGAADAVTHVLRGVLTKGTAHGLGLGRPAAGKTGTVDDFSAAWFAGYTPDLSSAVWVGDPRGGFGHPMDNVRLPGFQGTVFGASVPGPIWQDTMSAALKGKPEQDFHRPPGYFFSKGSGEDNIKMPDLRGLKLEEAIARLRAVGMEYQISPERVFSDQYKDGEIAETSPGPGESIDPGDRSLIVTLTVSQGKDPEVKDPEGEYPEGEDEWGDSPFFPHPTPQY